MIPEKSIAKRSQYDGPFLHLCIEMLELFSDYHGMKNEGEGEEPFGLLGRFLRREVIVNDKYVPKKAPQ